ncbi:uncharacterized protein K452DRAFT_64395 [Aplosporella prunicola CBS 121167]|uniref:Uncharacterized protein n=1 Tax=Aplosporella prunicola CBS 121167 TaxID=1176127 RepID=A0A6A6B822_9PEZI|nr:uncharacterized protein K452DRAFT_64395 [Aplosporella prunicola CBS 121167]KAF2139708.1 hypothetical protein K452DRAFT_64395 [Aplosporella prunicola CBS 121167]
MSCHVMRHDGNDDEDDDGDDGRVCEGLRCGLGVGVGVYRGQPVRLGRLDRQDSILMLMLALALVLAPVVRLYSTLYARTGLEWSGVERYGAVRRGKERR